MAQRFTFSTKSSTTQVQAAIKNPILAKTPASSEKKSHAAPSASFKSYKDREDALKKLEALAKELDEGKFDNNKNAKQLIELILSFGEEAENAWPAAAKLIQEFAKTDFQFTKLLSKVEHNWQNQTPNETPKSNETSATTTTTTSSHEEKRRPFRS